MPYNWNLYHVKGASNGVNHDKKGSKRPFAEERWVFSLSWVPSLTNPCPVSNILSRVMNLLEMNLSVSAKTNS